MSRSLTLAASVMILAGGLAACSSSRSPSEKTLSAELTRSDGQALTLAASSSTALRLVESTLGSELECGADLDPDTEKMLRHLQHRGHGARYTMRDHESTVVARRRGRQLRLDVSQHDGGGALEVDVPWALAECLLGARTDLDEILGSGKRMRVTLRGEDGESLELELR